MAHLLALDTTSSTASLSLWDEDAGQEIASRKFESTRSIDTSLFDPLQEILDHLSGLSSQKLTTIIIGTGPGSYNGARAGIAATQALSMSYDCPLIGLPSFYAHPQALSAVKTHFIGDARRHQYFHLTFQNGQPLHEIELLDPNAAKELILSHQPPPQATQGTASPLIAPQPSDDFYFLSDEEKQLLLHQAPNATHLAQAWRSFTEDEKRAHAQKPVDAYYLRPPHITQSKKSPPLLPQ